MTKIPILVSDLIAYVVTGKKELYLAIFNDKKENAKVKKRICVPVEIIRIAKNEFNLEIKPGETESMVFISSSYLPTGDKYLVKNFDQSSAVKLLCEAKHEGGVFCSNLECCFTGDNNEMVTFISEDQESYQEVFDEMVRRFFAKSGKKVRKWIPGHRYDSQEKTYYYLGQFLARKKNNTLSTFYNTSDELTPVHLYIDKLGTEKTVEEVFLNRFFGENDPDGIKVIWGNLPGCIDSGQKLETGSSDISLRFLYPELIKKNPLEALCFVSPDDSLDFLDNIRTTIKDWVKSDLSKCLYDSVGIQLDEKTVKEKNENSIVALFDLYLDQLTHLDPNACSKTYHTGLFSALGIDLKEIAKDVIQDWDEEALSRTFEDYINNIRYFKKRQTCRSHTSYQRDGDKKITLEELYGNSELTNELINLVNFAVNNYGSGISDFRVVEVTKSKYHMICKISCEDLLDYVGSNLTESLKDEIIERKFTTLTLYLDNDTVIK